MRYEDSRQTSPAVGLCNRGRRMLAKDHCRAFGADAWGDPPQRHLQLGLDVKTPLPLVWYNQSWVFTRRDPVTAGGESSHDASKEVSDVLERRRRQDRQNAGHGFHLKLHETQQHDQAPKKHHLQPAEDVSSAEQRPRRHQLPPTASGAGRSTGEIQEAPGPRPLAPNLHTAGEKKAAATS